MAALLRNRNYRQQRTAKSAHLRRNREMISLIAGELRRSRARESTSGVNR